MNHKNNLHKTSALACRLRIQNCKWKCFHQGSQCTKAMPEIPGSSRVLFSRKWEGTKFMSWSGSSSSRQVCRCFLHETLKHYLHTQLQCEYQ